MTDPLTGINHPSPSQLEQINSEYESRVQSIRLPSLKERWTRLFRDDLLFLRTLPAVWQMEYRFLKMDVKFLLRFQRKLLSAFLHERRKSAESLRAFARYKLDDLRTEQLQSDE